MNWLTRKTFCIYVISGILLIALPRCSEEPDKDVPPGAGNGGTERAEDWLPHVVPYLDCVPSAIDGQGSAVVEPSGPLPAGSPASFQITFTVGEAGVAAGGYVMLQVSPWWGWSDAQTIYPGLPGFTNVSTSFSDPFLKVQTLQLNRILVFSQQRAFQPGETITFSYGNGARVDRYAEAEELFQIFVDADGDGHSACIAAPPTLRTLARAPRRLNVTTPSQAVPGEAIEVRAVPLDAVENWSECPPGTYTLEAMRDGQPLSSTTLEVAGGNKAISFTYTPPEEGIYFFNVRGTSELRGKSNVMLCQEGRPKLKLYFGDIHGHSRMSDGTGTPEDYYRYARQVSDLNIAALTDHSDYGTIPIKGSAWERIKRAADDAYEPGRFVTFLGFEWTNWECGHRNVYYRDGDGPVFRSIDAESNTPQKLWKLIEPYEAMTVAHHVGGGPVATDWDIAPGPNEWLVEISSIHGSSEYFGGEASIYSPVKGASVRDALARGYKLGIIASGDTHDGHPGQRSVGAVVNGLLAVYSPELTREAVWEAFRKRHVYGTSGPKIILNFRVADSPMGSETTWAASKGPVPLALRAVGCDDIAAAEIIRNGETVFAEKADGVFVQFLMEDPHPPPGTS
ncbi:MAG: DUF3604 domain-containing protein, partial [Candidatus Hydrogenedentota bacterium]